MKNKPICEKCAFCNVFLITNVPTFPLDGNECGVFGLGKCDKVFFQYCKGSCYVPKQPVKCVQLSFNF